MAIDWRDPAVIGQATRMFSMIAVFLSGLATWNVVRTAWFEWEFLTGKRKWRWTMVLYMGARLGMLTHVYIATINALPYDDMPCALLCLISKLGHAVGILSAAMILVLRTRAVWNFDWKVTTLIGAMWIGILVIWSHTFQFQKTEWNPRLRVCQAVETPPQGELIAAWVLTMVFEIIVLGLCTYRLLSNYQYSSLGDLLLRDGIAYFCAVCIATIIPTVLVSLNLPIPIMNVMGVPSAVVTTVVASTTIFRNLFTAHDQFTDVGFGNGMKSIAVDAVVSEWYTNPLDKEDSHQARRAPCYGNEDVLPGAVVFKSQPGFDGHPLASAVPEVRLSRGPSTQPGDFGRVSGQIKSTSIYV